ncbi:MAG: Trk system potassium transporter TrkA [Clostridiales bacterium]|nr:Trk system potassium transporter TrkA [Clostridiales bacterium]
MQANTAKVKPGRLHIIIVGCGKVGHTLTEQLVREGHDVTIVDVSERVIRDTAEVYDVMGIRGNGASLNVLMEAGLKEADLIIAVTGSDELNLLCCTIAKKAGGELAAIARVRNPDYAEELPYLRQQLGLSMIINPELEAAREIARLLSRPQALTVSAFAKGHAELVRFKIPSGNVLCGRSIMQLDNLFRFGYLVCAVERDGSVSIPSGSFVLHEGDDITILASSHDVHCIFDSIGMRGQAVKSCMIIGGGKSSYYLAKQLLEQKLEVKIIESNRQRCEELSTLLPEALVICGDGGDEELLKEEGIGSAEAFVPLTGLDEENILLTLYAKRIPGLKTITKINRITFNDVIDGLELGSVVYPKYITSEAIIAYVRARQNSIGSNVETLYHMFDNRVEAIEFHVKKDAPVCGVPLMQLRKKDHLLIACINRGGRIIFPRGQDAIMEGDSVIIVTTHTGFGDISDILR